MTKDLLQLIANWMNLLNMKHKQSFSFLNNHFLIINFLLRENNTELQRAMATHSSNLKMLSIPLPELTKKICGGFTNPGF